MWQLEEGRGQEPDNEKGEKGMVVEPLAFPDPFELGTLEVRSASHVYTCRVLRNKLILYSRRSPKVICQVMLWRNER